MDATSTPVVFVHGGGGDSRIWEPLLPHFAARPTLAVDLPGRGRHPLPFDEVTFEICARSVVEDIDEAGFDEIVLVGHSMAGCSLPGIVSLLGHRARHVVFIACVVPPDGKSAYDLVDPALKAELEASHADPSHTEPRAMDPAIGRVVFGNDLDDEQWAWVADRMLPEAPGLTTAPVASGPLRRVPLRTWVRTVRDVIVPPEQQLVYAETAGGCDVVDIDAGHLCMVSQTAMLAKIIDNAIGRGSRAEP